MSDTKHIMSAFDSELKTVIADVLQMGELVLEMMDYAKRVLDKPSDELVQEARALDKKINALDFGLQKKATNLIALRQPMGVDLRFAVSVLKIGSSLERMGDLAKSTCRKAGRFSGVNSLEVNDDLKEMNELATKMVADVLIAFREQSVEKADHVMDADDALDNSYRKLLKDVEVLVRNKPEAIPSFADIIFAAKNFERVGDHASKIADLIHYITAGQLVAKMRKAEAKNLRAPNL